MRTADDARTSDETRARSELNIRVSVVELVVAWLLIFGLVTSIGVLITKVFEPTQPIYGEDRLNRWLQSFRTPTWDTVTAVGSLLAETTTMIALVFLAVVVMRLAFGRWRESIYVLVSIVGETIMFLARRPRDLSTQTESAAPRQSSPDIELPVGTRRRSADLLRLNRHRDWGAPAPILAASPALRARSAHHAFRCHVSALPGHAPPD